MKKLISLTLLTILSIIFLSGCTNKYDDCTKACMDTYPSYSWNTDYTDCKQSCIDKYK